MIYLSNNPRIATIPRKSGSSPVGSFPPRGMTLIELLVVVSIMAILAALMIPRLRIINQDRNIREAARIVGSVFATASQRAVNEGTAGVIIERNANLLDADGVNYAGTVLYVMRPVPPYAGDSEFDFATRTNDFVLTIPVPLEQSQNIVARNDYVSVNRSSVRYQILDVLPRSGALDLLLSDGVQLDGTGVVVMPPLPGVNNATYPFVIHRQPRRLESSRVELPEGYLIDLRYSGELGGVPRDSSVAEVPRSWFHDVINPLFLPMNPDRYRTTQVIFDSNGMIDRYYFHDPNPNLIRAGRIVSKIPLGSLYLLVTTFEIEPKPNHGVLDDPSNLWVTIGNNTGGVNIGYNVPSIPGTLGNRILSARNLAINGQNAAQ